MTSLGRRIKSPVTRRLPAALFWSCAVEILLRLATMQRTAETLSIRLEFGRRGPESPPLRLDQWSLRNSTDAHIWDAVRRVMSVWPFGRHGTCLRESLVMARMLRHRDPAVMLGVAP